MLALTLLWHPALSPASSTIQAGIVPGPYISTRPQSAAFARRPQSQALITIHGTVRDYSTARHQAVPRQVVVAQIRRGGRVLTTVRSRTDARGAFALAVPPLPRGADYVLVTDYSGVPYEMDIASGQITHPVQVKVYQTTSSDDQLAAMGVVIGVRCVGHTLNVREQWPFANAGNRTVVGADLATGRGAALFPLPPGATHVAVDPKGTVAATATVSSGAVVASAIVRPATGLNAASLHQVTFTFELPVPSGHPTLLISTRYFIGSLYIATDGSRLVAPGFKQVTLALAPGMLTWQAQAIPANSTIAVGVDGPPVVGTVAVPPGAFPVLGVGAIVGAGFVALLLLGLLGRGGARREPAGHTALQREYARLVAAIAELDLRHERGEVPPPEYDARRAEQKAHLLRVARRLGA